MPSLYHKMKKYRHPFSENFFHCLKDDDRRTLMSFVGGLDLTDGRYENQPKLHYCMSRKSFYFHKFIMTYFLLLKKWVDMSHCYNILILPV